MTQPGVQARSIWPNHITPEEGELLVREGDLVTYINEGRTDLEPELVKVRERLAVIRADKEQ